MSYPFARNVRSEGQARFFHCSKMAKGPMSTSLHCQSFKSIEVGGMIVDNDEKEKSKATKEAVVVMLQYLVHQEPKLSIEGKTNHCHNRENNNDTFNAHF